MTEQETIDRVTSALTGEFYVGQRVRVAYPGSAKNDWIGIITRFQGLDIVYLDYGHGDLDPWNIHWLEPA